MSSMCSWVWSVEQSADKLQRNGEHDGEHTGHERPENDGSSAEFPRCSHTLGGGWLTMQGSVQLLHGDRNRPSCRGKAQLIHAAESPEAGDHDDQRSDGSLFSSDREQWRRDRHGSGGDEHER